MIPSTGLCFDATLQSIWDNFRHHATLRYFLWVKHEANEATTGYELVMRPTYVVLRALVGFLRGHIMHGAPVFSVRSYVLLTVVEW